MVSGQNSKREVNDMSKKSKKKSAETPEKAEPAPLYQPQYQA
ncbi:MAG: hypothetical protein VZR73_02365 [Acutalibacteraceae bacterium]|nr:hypothetical protein [Acutalibacteraceae bacterium]